MALTKLTAVLNKISSLGTVIRGQATSVKAAFDNDVNIVKDFINDTLIPEIESIFETKSNITTNRKLSNTGNFTGTWNGKAYTETDPGLQAKVNELIDNLAQINTSITLSSGFTVNDQNTVRRYGNVITIYEGLTGTIPANTTIVIGTITDIKSRPSFNVWGVCVSDIGTTGTVTGVFSILTTGEVRVRFPSAVGAVIFSTTYVK